MQCDFLFSHKQNNHFIVSLALFRLWPNCYKGMYELCIYILRVVIVNPSCAAACDMYVDVVVVFFFNIFRCLVKILILDFIHYLSCVLCFIWKSGTIFCGGCKWIHSITFVLHTYTRCSVLWCVKIMVLRGYNWIFENLQVTLLRQWWQCSLIGIENWKYRNPNTRF